jgi:hypothetical protein
MNEKLSTIERDLRRAVECRHFAEIQRLVCSFCEAAEAQIKALPPGDPRIQEIGNMTLELLQWCRTMVQSARECLVLELSQIPKVKRYIPAAATVPAALSLNV